MIKIFYKALVYLIVLTTSLGAIGITPAEEDAKTQLLDLLSKETFNRAILRKKAVEFKDHKFRLGRSGQFYLEEKGKRYPLQIFINENTERKEFLIFDHHNKGVIKPNPMSTLGSTPAQLNAFDDIVSAQRKLGIYTMKSKNPECYFAYAEERLIDNPYERLLAMERPDNPRPLVFKDDMQYAEFKDDLINLFSDFKSPESYIAIIGTSTTFFSENPRKGKNRALFEKAPQCIKRAEDPKASQEVYTFDTPGKDLSDLDIHVLIPQLSELCEKAQVWGNNGSRETYYENTLDKCFLVADEARLRAMVKPVKGMIDSLFAGSMVPGQALDEFFKKWQKLLDGRAINFSVHIRPDLSGEPRKKPEENNFEQSPYIKGRFVIPIN